MTENDFNYYDLLQNINKFLFFFETNFFHRTSFKNVGGLSLSGPKQTHTRKNHPYAYLGLVTLPPPKKKPPSHSRKKTTFGAFSVDRVGVGMGIYVALGGFTRKLTFA